MLSDWCYSNPVKVHFGSGIINNLSEYVLVERNSDNNAMGYHPGNFTKSRKNTGEFIGCCV